MNWLQIKNIILTRRLLLFYTTTVSHFSIGLWRTTKSGFYLTTSDDQLSGWTEKTLQSISQSQICTKKTSWSLFGALLPVWSTTAFWVPAKTLHLRSMLSKSTSCTKTATPAVLHDKAQLHTAQPTLQKLNKLGYKVLPQLPCSPDLSPITTSLNNPTPFRKEQSSTACRRQKMCSKRSLNPESWIFRL